MSAVNNILRRLPLNFLLRGGAAGVKFFFILYLANFQSAVVVGQYAIVATIIAMAIQFIGLELNSAAGRLMHRDKGIYKKVIIIAQYRVYLLSYFITSPIIYAVFYYFVLADLILSFVFLCVVILEHVLTEIFRTLVSDIKVALATKIQFAKSVPYLILLVMYLSITNEEVTISTILYVWLLNLGIVFYYVCVSCQRFWLVDKLSYTSSDLLNTAKQLVMDGFPYFLIAVTSVLFLNLDKFFIKSNLGHELLGVYFTYFSICSILSLLISFTVGVKQGPIAIKAFSEYGHIEYFKVRKVLFNGYIKILAIGGCGVLILGLCFALVTSNELYYQNLNVFFVLLFANLILCFSQIYKLDLYLLKKDKLLFVLFLSSLTLNVCLLLILTPRYGMIGVSASLLISSFTLLYTMIYYSDLSIKNISATSENTS